MSMTNDDIKAVTTKFAAHNASQHDGKAQPGSVIGKILAEYPELKPRVKEVMPIIQKTIKEVNSWTQEQQQEYVEKNNPELLEKKKIVEAEKVLPPLENVDARRGLRRNPDRGTAGSATSSAGWNNPRLPAYYI